MIDYTRLEERLNNIQKRMEHLESLNNVQRIAVKTPSETLKDIEYLESKDSSPDPDDSLKRLDNTINPEL